MLYPINTTSRIRMDLGGIWSFRPDDGNAFAEGWQERPLKDPMTMPVPASYNDMKEEIGLRDHYGWVFYQRNIEVPAYLCERQRVVLRCDAVTHHAIVYLNGTKIAEHRGGFLPFETEIGGLLRNGGNLLTIAVDNTIDDTTLPVGKESGMFESPSPSGRTYRSRLRQNRPNFDFFNYSGITRSVEIYTTPRHYIRDITVTAALCGEDAELFYEIEDGRAKGGDVSGDISEDGAGEGAGSRAQGAASGADVKEAGQGEPSCLVEILDREGNLAASGEGMRGSILLKDVHLWQPLAAYLYTVRVTMGEDVYELPYGVRTVEVRGQQFLINGKPFYFKGYGKHEDTFPNGRGLNLPMAVKDISLMKWQHANSFRCSHYPYSEEMMRLADEEGIVVIDETPAVGINLRFGGGADFEGRPIGTFDKEHGIRTFDHHKEVIRDLIARDKNHACVVMWSIANEPDSGAEGAYEYFKPLYELARESDPQKRPCTLASVVMAGGPDTDVSARLSDVICLNRYYGWYVGGPELDGPEELLRAELQEWEKTGKPVIFTEYGADTVAGLHDTTPVMYTEEYQVDYYKMNNRVFDEFRCVVGEQAWNFADFATSQSLVRVQGNRKGLFTRDRKPKLAAHYFRERWGSIPDFGYKE